MTEKVIEEIKGCHSVRWYDAVGEKEDVWDEHRLSLILERERLEAWLDGVTYADPDGEELIGVTMRESRLAALRKELSQ